MKQVQETTDKLESDMVATSRQLAVFEDAITKQVDDKIMEQIKIERRKGAQNAQKHSALNAAIHSEGLGQLKTMMQMKADKNDLERVCELKCNKIDFENVLDIQNIMCKQFKQILVLFIEMLNCETSKAHDTRQG